MKLTVKFKILPTKEQEKYLTEILKEYISTVNRIVQVMINTKHIKLTSKDIEANLPSAVKNQAIQDAKSVYKKYKKTNKLPILKKPACIWNNQNYKITDCLSFPVFVNGKTKRIKVKILLTDYQKQQLNNKLGTLRITKKSGKWMAQVAVEVVDKQNNNENIMGVDLGLKVPAVAVTSNGKTRFFGNGRQNKYIRRKYKVLRQRLGKAKKLKKIKQIADKEQRWMKDQDHKISRQIVNFAVENNVSVIRLENLTNIRNTARTSRKNEKNLHTWSFYRLSKYIEYKANLEGIKVEYVNPKYTSQKCPKCQTLNKANDRKYMCKCCGYKTHRDRVGAFNIMYAPVADGVA
ncbi:RNA-guided endonuclease InsQ/TnpB family protein [Parageobacillus galactosidasius]|uniref:Transposase n=1 Tax=Parageobacillus galactosidasius TaxID=883812 RepID=A0A226QQB8_9BACL|nr:RNA-guided endonuclease TnpB family protein [Parageobacillus galactosidasius]OXB94726.1 transposase [Parageobacillus galactosidasius]